MIIVLTEQSSPVHRGYIQEAAEIQSIAMYLDGVKYTNNAYYSQNVNLQEITLIFPQHKASLHLTHNEHLGSYETVQQLIDDKHCDYTSWISEEQKEKAIEANDCWTLHWYPDTPIGFYTLAAHDLDKLLEEACKVDIH